MALSTPKRFRSSRHGEPDPQSGSRSTTLDRRPLLKRAGRWLGSQFAPPALAGLAAAIPVISATAKALRQAWVPAADDGIILTRALDVFTSHSPLVGQYSEAGSVTGQIVHSPGPMLYWLLAIPVRLGGPASAMVAIGVVNTLAIIGCVALARRRGGLALMFATAIAIALMCHSLGAAVLYDVWNPSAAMFPFLFLIFLAWSLSCGDYRLMPAVVIVASFVVQTHLAYLAPSAGIIVVGLCGLALRRGVPWWQSHRGRVLRPARAFWRWLAMSFAALFVCWSFPLLDEIENSPGNLTLIARTASDRGTTLGVHVGWTAVVRAIGWRPWWLIRPASEFSRKFDVRMTAGSVARDSTILILVVLVTIMVGAAYRRRGDLAAAAAIGLVMCLGLAADAANTPVAPLLWGTLAYTMWWGSQLGMWVWLTLGWTGWIVGRWAIRRAWPSVYRALSGLPNRVPPARRNAALGAVVLVATAGTGVVGGAVAANLLPEARAAIYKPIRALGKRLDALIPPGQTIDYAQGKLDATSRAAEPALRFMLSEHGDRVLSVGAFPRLGAYYTLYRQPYQWKVVIADGTVAPAGTRLAARARLPRSGRGYDTVSLWVRHVAPQGASSPGARRSPAVGARRRSSLR